MRHGPLCRSIMKTSIALREHEKLNKFTNNLDFLSFLSLLCLKYDINAFTFSAALYFLA